MLFAIALLIIWHIEMTVCAFQKAFLWFFFLLFIKMPLLLALKNSVNTHIHNSYQTHLRSD